MALGALDDAATRRLIAAIDSASDRAYGSENNEDLAAERANALDRFLGKNIDPAPVGRSQVRDRTVFETVQWTRPSLLRIFTSGNEVCKFEPVGPEDEAAAEQESDYINYVLTQRNSFFTVLDQLVQDGLLLKNGYLHAYWDETQQTESETYEALSDDAFALLAQDPEIQIAAHSQRPNEVADKRNQQQYQQAVMQWQQQAQQAAMQAQQTGQPPQIPPQPQQPQPAFLHDVTLKRVRKRGQVKLCTLAPERCLVDIAASSFSIDETCSYFEFFDWQTLGQLRAKGMDLPDDIVSETDDRWINGSSVENARDRFGEDREESETTGFDDMSMRLVKVRYIWVRHDANGDGINELLYVVRIGDTIVSVNESEQIPVASWSPNPLAHRHIGMSQADEVIDLEDINTNLIRQTIDNLNLSNTPRVAVDADKVNLSDLLDVRVGGVIRVDGSPGDAFMPVMTPSVFGDAVQAVSFFDSRRQNRTGINAYFQGTDANVLNKTASGIAQLTNSAAQRVETIARYLANCIERAFLIVHRLILQHGHSQEVVRLRNTWVTIDPSEWKRRYDVRISVGLGTGNKESVIAQLNNLFQMQMAAAPMGVANPLNVYNTLSEIAKASGFSTPDRFVTDPQKNPPPQQPPPPQVMVEQMRQQGEAQKLQFEAQQSQMQTQAEQMMAKWETEQKLALEKWKAELDAQTKLTLEQMRLQSTAELETRKLLSGEMSQAEQLKRQDAKDSVEVRESAIAAVQQQLAEVVQAFQALVADSASKKVIGVEKVRDPKTGRMIGGRIHRANGESEDITIQ